MSQITEDFVGYELRFLSLLYPLALAMSQKVYRLARIAFAGKYEESSNIKMAKNLLSKVLYSNNSNVPAYQMNAKVGSVSLSPRGDLRMPSDAYYDLWMNELEDL